MDKLFNEPENKILNAEINETFIASRLIFLQNMQIY